MKLPTKWAVSCPYCNDANLVETTRQSQGVQGCSNCDFPFAWTCRYDTTLKKVVNLEYPNMVRYYLKTYRLNVEDLNDEV